MEFEYFDVHCHIFSPDLRYGEDFGFSEEEKQILFQKLQEQKIGILNCAHSDHALRELMSMKDLPGVYLSAGFHPESIPEFDEQLLGDIIQNLPITAIGETGLDNYYLKKEVFNPETYTLSWERQIEIFEKHIEIGKKHRLALSVHLRGDREVFQTAYTLFQKHAPLPATNLHFYTGGKKMIKQFADLGCFFSFGGALLLAQDIQETLKVIPEDRILSETDAPFMAPVKGEKNTPLSVIAVVEKISEIRGKDIKEKLVKNAKNYLHIA